MHIKQISDKQFQVRSASEKEYDVFVDRGKASCTCADFVFRGMRKDCKHIRVVLDQIKKREK